MPRFYWCPPVADGRRLPARDDRGPAGGSAGGRSEGLPVLAEARIKGGRRALDSIKQRESLGKGLCV